MDQTKEMAKFALQLIEGANVRADDATLGNALLVRKWLKAIAAGELVVAEPLKPEAK